MRRRVERRRELCWVFTRAVRCAGFKVSSHVIEKQLAFVLAGACAALLLLACQEPSPNQTALRAEYDAAWRNVSGGEFSASYQLAGSGESLVARGRLNWIKRGPDVQRFDGDIETSQGEHDLTTLIQSGTHRIVCDMARLVCSDYLTALQGSDFYAIALLLPVNDWADDPAPTIVAAQSQQIPSGFDGTATSSPTDKCFRWEKRTEGVAFETCFRRVDGLVSRRSFHSTDKGTTYDFEWTLTDVSSEVPPTAFDPPYPVKHGGN